ncbi:MAG: sigma-54-dependent Fis family transcriptional regulator [Acidobacteria bacterium]|nr:sigma-54-dependent Fis family transcriptional regulator [Acidobacteriota bacterium]
MTAAPNSLGKPAVLVVEDDAAFSTTLLALLESEGYPVEVARSSEEALERLAQHSFPIVVSDIYLDQRTGLDILRRARALEPRCAVILITGKGSLDTVLEATRAGAFDYLAKPFALERLARAVSNAAAAWRETSVPAEGADRTVSAELVGTSNAMVEVYKFISRVADADSTVLLQGETGTGKERVARMIHESGGRRAGRFVVVDCGALSASLLEAELFGALRGAYTGADRDRTGLLESADGGTVFLDEIGEMDLAFQQRLLRFLQEREVRPLGATASRKVDVRVVAASNRDLRQLVAEKKFREDLWYRLQVACLTLAPLRERREDIPLLVEHFLATHRERLGKSLRLSEQAMSAAQEYSWPGNVRQLQNLIERLAILHPATVVEENAFAEALKALDPGPGARVSADARASDSLSGIEEEHIRRVLEATHGNKTRAAEILGIERKTLYRKLERMRESEPSRPGRPG